MTTELAIRILTGDVLGTNEQTHEAVKMAVEALMPSAQPEQRWIPCTCSERMPKEYGNYLVTEMPMGDFEIEPYLATYYPEDDEWTTGSPIKIVRRPVIAWMPLPEPYKEDKDGN